MALVTTKEMFKKAYDGGYAVGAFNVNNMEIIQGITEAAGELKAPVILQVSKGARAYANHTYLVKLVEAAVIENPDIPIALHLDHGDSFELCKSCIDGGFTSVMIDASSKSFEDNIALTRKVVEYAHDHGVVVEAELGTLAGVEDDVKVEHGQEMYTHPEEVEEFVTRTGCDSLAIAIGTSPRRVQVQARSEAPAALRGAGRMLQASARLPDRPARRFFCPAGVREGNQPVWRQYARRNWHSGRAAGEGGEDGGLQDQHRLRHSSGDDREHPQVLRGTSGSL